MRSKSKKHRTKEEMAKDVLAALNAPMSYRAKEGVFELKWGRHTRGEKYLDFVASKEGVTCISILIRGMMRLIFKRGTETQTVTLQTEGDFVLWQPDVCHNSEFLEDTLVLTIKWPSVKNPKDHPPPHNLPGSAG